MVTDEIDVAQVRRDTPGCADWAHFNNAGASLTPQPVADTVMEHLQLELRLGGYEAAEAARPRLDGVRDSAARLINCDPTEIALLENATRAFNAVLYALPLGPGDRIVTGRSEYASNYMAYLHLRDTRGADVLVVPDDEHGQVDVDALGARLDDRVKLIALTHVPTSGGLVNPVAAVGRLARDACVPFLLDACQSVGQLPIDVAQIGCDFLSTTGRKYLRGPRGTGFLYVRREHAERLHPPQVDLGGADWTRRDGYDLKPGARRFETWEASQALQLGLGRAIDYALDVGVERSWPRIAALAGRLRSELEAIPGVELHDLGATRCGIVSFSVAGTPPEAVKAKLAAAGVHVELSSVEDTRLDLGDRGLTTFLRASAHYYNSDDEIDLLLSAVSRP
jgi:cysteine desulfurase/selenocysteine lyase